MKLTKAQAEEGLRRKNEANSAGSTPQGHGPSAGEKHTNTDPPGGSTPKKAKVTGENREH